MRHQSAKSITKVWLTPKEILSTLGAFDLDPCSHKDHPWPIAPVTYYLPMDGLTLPWFGRVYCNPPYSVKECDQWLQKCRQHGNAVALVFARVDTDWFFRNVWHGADAVLFLKHHLYFHRIDGSRAEHNSGAPSCLVAYGAENVETLRNCGLDGFFLELKPTKTPEPAPLSLF